MVKITLLGFDEDYQKIEALSLSERYNITTVNINSNIRLFLNIIRRVSYRYYDFLCKRYLKKILIDVDKDSILIFLDDEVSMRCLSFNDFRKRAIIFRNLYKPKSFSLQDLSKENVFSFDKNDCEKYGFNYLNQYISSENLFSKPEDNNTKNFFDFYFIGKDKGRSSKIKLIKKHLVNNGYKCNFILKKSDHNIWGKVQKKVLKNKSYVYDSYLSNLENIKSTKVIFEFNKHGQEGITLRSLEAMFSEKKLITNNKKIKEYDFYDERNIYIYDEDDFQAPTVEFVNSSFFSIPNNVLNKYNVCNVFSEIISIVNHDKNRRG